jgi:hypothetical protein
VPVRFGLLEKPTKLKGSEFRFSGRGKLAGLETVIINFVNYCIRKRVFITLITFIHLLLVHTYIILNLK